MVGISYSSDAEKMGYLTSQDDWDINQKYFHDMESSD